MEEEMKHGADAPERMGEIPADAPTPPVEEKQIEMAENVASDTEIASSDVSVAAPVVDTPTDVVTDPAQAAAENASKDIPATPEQITDGQQAEEVRRVYPDFDPDREMQDPVFRGLCRGELRPTLRQIYELCHYEELLSRTVQSAVETARAEATEQARRDLLAELTLQAEAAVVDHIRACGHRPLENAMSVRGVRPRPDVSHLTRRDRALLAHRAERGENVEL